MIPRSLETTRWPGLRDASAPAHATGGAVAESAETRKKYRETAAECERQAASMVNAFARATMLFVARRWRELADEDDPAANAKITPKNEASS